MPRVSKGQKRRIRDQHKALHAAKRERVRQCPIDFTAHALREANRLHWHDEHQRGVPGANWRRAVVEAALWNDTGMLLRACRTKGNEHGKHVRSLCGQREPPFFTFKKARKAKKHAATTVEVSVDRTPLHIALRSGHVFVVRALLQLGCDPASQSQIGRDGLTAVQLAARLQPTWPSLADPRWRAPGTGMPRGRAAGSRDGAGYAGSVGATASRPAHGGWQPQERRLDWSVGGNMAFTQAEFAAFYGGMAEWNAAPRVAAGSSEAVGWTPDPGGGRAGWRGSDAQLLLNGAGLPERPGGQRCRTYMETGACQYGAVCWFDHPADAAARDHDDASRDGRSHWSFRGEGGTDDEEEEDEGEEGQEGVVDEDGFDSTDYEALSQGSSGGREDSDVGSVDGAAPDAHGGVWRLFAGKGMPGERRMDFSVDCGATRTQAEFIAIYGGMVEWNAAPRVAAGNEMGGWACGPGHPNDGQEWNEMPGDRCRANAKRQRRSVSPTVSTTSTQDVCWGTDEECHANAKRHRRSASPTVPRAQREGGDRETSVVLSASEAAYGELVLQRAREYESEEIFAFLVDPERVTRLEGWVPVGLSLLGPGSRWDGRPDGLDLPESAAPAGPDASSWTEADVKYCVGDSLRIWQRRVLELLHANGGRLAVGQVEPLFEVRFGEPLNKNLFKKMAGPWKVPGVAYEMASHCFVLIDTANASEGQGSGASVAAATQGGARGQRRRARRAARAAAQAIGAAAPPAHVAAPAAVAASAAEAASAQGAVFAAAQVTEARRVAAACGAGKGGTKATNASGGLGDAKPTTWQGRVVELLRSSGGCMEGGWLKPAYEQRFDEAWGTGMTRGLPKSFGKVMATVPGVSYVGSDHGGSNRFVLIGGATGAAPVATGEGNGEDHSSRDCTVHVDSADTLLTRSGGTLTRSRGAKQDVIEKRDAYGQAIGSYCTVCKVHMTTVGSEATQIHINGKRHRAAAAAVTVPAVLPSLLPLPPLPAAAPEPMQRFSTMNMPGEAPAAMELPAYTPGFDPSDGTAAAPPPLPPPPAATAVAMVVTPEPHQCCTDIATVMPGAAAFFACLQSHLCLQKSAIA
jgi:hypothetical protein